MAARVSHPHHPGAVKVVLVVLGLAAAAVFVPMWAPLVLAAWFAHFTRPMLARICRNRLAKRRRVAGVMVVAAMLMLLTPLVLITISLAASAVDLVDAAMKSKSGANALRALVSTDGNPVDPKALLSAPDKLFGLAKEHGTKAWTALNTIAGITASALIGFFVFLLGAYTFLVEGDKAYTWCEQHAPVRPDLFGRFAKAFNETGRGLLVGVVLTGAMQAGVATIAYLLLGVPSALVLGLLTFFASLIPSVGTALVWAPVAAGLALSGRTTAAIALSALGIVVIGSIDNFLRPVFAKWGKLDMPSFIVLVTMFGGLGIFGAWGLILGPLVVRLFIEALRIGREERLTGAHTTLSPPHPELGAE